MQLTLYIYRAMQSLYIMHSSCAMQNPSGRLSAHDSPAPRLAALCTHENPGVQKPEIRDAYKESRSEYEMPARSRSQLTKTDFSPFHAISNYIFVDHIYTMQSLPKEITCMQDA